MEEPEKPEKPIEIRALESLGLGFDLTCDFRLKFAKGSERLVALDGNNNRDIVIPGGVTIPGVSADIRCDKGDGGRFKSDMLEFDQMSELLNEKSSVRGKVPSGYLNTIFDLTGAWLNDAADNKYLSFDCYFVTLYYLHLTASPLFLRDKVKESVPSHWDPASLSRFIQTYGTHIIVGIAVGGQNLICVKQKASSAFPHAELRGLMEDLGDSVFSDGNPSLLPKKSREGKQKSNTEQFSSTTDTSSKNGLAIMLSKRGGDVFSHSHSNWLQTVSRNPEAILFKFVPITSLLTGIPGSGYLSHAIDLYLRYKPAPDDLRYFLEFQVPRQWAPTFNELPLGPQRRKDTCPALQFSFGGPKLNVSSTQVSSSRNPVIGLRLCLEGKKCNRLAILVQHLSSLPNIMALPSNDNTKWKPCQWRGSDDYDLNHLFLEPVEWKGYSNVCTSSVKHDPNWLQGEYNGVFIVTGAQLLSVGKWPKTVLHLRLLFSHLPNCTIRRTEWAAAPVATSKLGFLASLSTTFSQQKLTHPPMQVLDAVNSGYLDGPPVPAHNTKLLKSLNYVETAEVVRGPHDVPGHWLVTAAKLVTEGGKIGLHVKFALLDY